MLRIFDAHVHLFDCEANTYAFLDHEDRSFKIIAGDYSALPRRYLADDDQSHSAWCQMEGMVWYEFLSDDPVREAQWAQHLGDGSRPRQSMVVLVDFLDPALDERLEAYAALPNVVAVREHLGWDPGNALRRFAKCPDLLTDPAWRKGLGALRRHGFKCGIELFAPQLSDLPGVTRLYPDIGFTLAVLGWPLDLSPTGYRQWRHDLAVLSRYANVRIEIADRMRFRHGLAPEQVAPWILGHRNVRPLALHVRQSHADRLPVRGVRASLRCLSGDRGKVLRGRTGRHVQGRGGCLVQAALKVHCHVDSREDGHRGYPPGAQLCLRDPPAARVPHARSRPGHRQRPPSRAWRRMGPPLLGRRGSSPACDGTAPQVMYGIVQVCNARPWRAGFVLSSLRRARMARSDLPNLYSLLDTLVALRIECEGHGEDAT